jgi:hypothetical protein
MGLGKHDSGMYESGFSGVTWILLSGLQFGSHPPKQYEPVPQKPYSEQHGAEAGHGDVALHDAADARCESVMRATRAVSTRV